MIGVDLDEVLAAFLRAIIQFHNDAYGTELQYEDFHSYNF